MARPRLRAQTGLVASLSGFSLSVASVHPSRMGHVGGVGGWHSNAKLGVIMIRVGYMYDIIYQDL